MVRALKKTTIKLGIAASICSLFALGAFAQQQDPPYRVARLSYVNGNVSMEPAGVDDWAPAEVNHPFTTGDYLYTDQGAQAELHLDVAVMRMAPQTSFGFLNLDDQTVQIKLSEGEMYFGVRNFGSNQVFEVDTPNAAITLLQNGTYTISVDANNNTSFVVVREGQAQVTGGGQAFTLSQGQSANLSGTDQLSYNVDNAPDPDQFEDWAAQRDQRQMNRPSARYVPPTVIGYEDLDDYGGWQTAGNYGPVWYPNSVPAGWAPYSAGTWTWVDPWGWTWVDAAPWGFAPFHYGRWVYAGSRWGWAPGPLYSGYGGPMVRPWYSPALVAFFGGSNWGVSIGFGGGFGGPSLGWCPLGWGDVYTPPYVVSAGYFRSVNEYNTRITNVNITNVYNTVYVNKAAYNQQIGNMRAPNAVRAMPQSAFASGRSVAQIARAVPAAQVARIQPGAARVIAPAVAPTRQAVLPTAGRGPAVRPAAQVLQRPVVARVKPPAPPPSFAARQSYLQQHAGQPINHAAMRQAIGARATPAVAVRQAPPARPVAARPGERHGNVAAMPAGRQPAAAGRPGQPATAARPGQPVAPNRAAPAPAARPGTETRQPAPAAHGTPPNRQPAAQPGARTAPEARPAPAPAARPETRPAPATRPETRPTPETRTAPTARPETRQPAPATHGTPPSRQPAPENRAGPTARPETRPAPESRTAPAARPETRQPAPAARPAPETRQPAPAARPAPETRQPAPAARPAPETRQPAPAARPAPETRQPAPAARPAPETRPAPQSRQQTRPEAKPAQPAHGAPPARTERSTKDTKEQPK